jgi:hypothetical protein
MTDIGVRSSSYLVPEDRSWLGSAHGTNATETGTLDVSTLTLATHFPNGLFKSGSGLYQLASGVWTAALVGGDTNEVQTVTEGGSGLTSFTLTYAGQTTASIAAAATAATVQQALADLSNLDSDDVSVTGSAGGPYTVTFKGNQSPSPPPPAAPRARVSGPGSSSTPSPSPRPPTPTLGSRS